MSKIVNIGRKSREKAGEPKPSVDKGVPVAAAGQKQAATVPPRAKRRSRHIDDLPLAAAVMNASTDGDLSRVLELLKAGEDPNEITLETTTPFELVIGSGNVPMIKLFLEHGARWDLLTQPLCFTPSPRRTIATKPSNFSFKTALTSMPYANKGLRCLNG